MVWVFSFFPFLIYLFIVSSLNIFEDSYSSNSHQKSKPKIWYVYLFLFQSCKIKQKSNYFHIDWIPWDQAVSFSKFNKLSVINQQIIFVQNDWLASVQFYKFFIDFIICLYALDFLVRVMRDPEPGTLGIR